MFNLLLFLPSIILYRKILSADGFRIRVADTYFLTYLATFIFYDGINEGSGNIFHVFYFVFWPLFFIAGYLLAVKKEFKILVEIKKIHLYIKIPLFFLLLYFFYFSLKNYDSLTSIDLSNYDAIRQDTTITYFEYMFSKSLVFFIFLYVFFSTNSKTIRIIYFALLLISASATLQKSLILYSFISIFIFKASKLNKPLKISQAAIFLTFALLISTMTSWLIYGSDILVTINAVFRRIFWLPADLSYSTLKMADEYNFLYLGGASLKTLFDFLSLPSMYLGEATYIYYFGEIHKAASANSPMLTALYADFSYFGLFFSIFFGYFLKKIDILFLRSNKSTLTTAAYATLIICVLKFNITNFGTAFVSEGFLIVFLIFIFSLQRNSTKNLGS